MRKILTSVAILGVAFCCVTGVRANVPDLIPVQGVLTDQFDNPIDGMANIQFAIYDSEVGGTMIWSELYNGVNQVEVVDGFFTVYMGSLNTIAFEDFLQYPELWMGITVGLDDEMDRIRLASVPFAEEARFCTQIGDLMEEDIQEVLDFTCGGDQFLRGWSPDGGPVCGTDITSTGMDGGTITDVYAGTGLNKAWVSGNPELSVVFGSTAGTVAEGNHLHAGVYQPLTSGGPCAAGSFVSHIDPGTGALTCTDESTGESYTSGAGITFTTVGEDTEISVDTAVMQIKLAGSCDSGEFVSDINPDLGTFTCTSPPGSEYTPGEGINIDGSNNVSVDFTTAQRIVYTTSTTTNGMCDDGDLVRGIDPATGVITCVVDLTTTGEPGSGIISITALPPLNGGGSDVNETIGIDMGTAAGTAAWGDHDHDATYPAIADTLAGMTCAPGQILEYDLTLGWICAADDDTNTNAATICTGDNTYLDGEGGCDVINLAGYQLDIAATSCGLGIASIANDGTVTCSSTDANTTYSNGAGLSLAGTVFSVNFGGTGVANTAARSDHNHDTNYAPASHTHAWGDVTGKPATYPPSTHTHTWTDIADPPAVYPDSDLLDGLDSTAFATAAHNHTGVYSPVGHLHDDRYYTETEVDNLLSGKADTSHTHSGYAATVHTHSAGDITSGTLSTDRYDAYNDLTVAGVLDNNAGTDLLTRTQLDARFAPLSHTHNWSSITGTPAKYPDSELLDGLDSTAFAASGHDHDGSYMPGIACGDGEILEYETTTTSWVCALDDSGAYTEGEGIIIDVSDQISVDFSVAQRIVYTASTVTNGICDAGDVVGGIDPATGEVICVLDATVGGEPGTGIIQVNAISPINGGGNTPTINIGVDVGTTASTVAAGNHLHDATYVNEGQTNSITSAMITNGTIAAADLAIPYAQACSTICTDANTTYSQGTGITIASNVISSTLGTSIDTSEIVNGTITPDDIGAIGDCNNICTDADTIYGAGPGIDIDGSDNISVLYGGTGSNNTAARSDHNHSGTYAPTSHNHTWSNITDPPAKYPDADLLDGLDSTAFASSAHNHDGSYAPLSHVHSAVDITIGTLSTSRYDAYNDLSVAGILDNNADTDLLTRGQADGRYALTAHGHDHGTLTGLGDDDHTQYFNLSQNETATGRPSFNGGTTGSTSPFLVDSTYVVANLNADQLDGYHASSFLTGCSSCYSDYDTRYIARNGDTFSHSGLYDLTYTGSGSYPYEFNHNGTAASRYGIRSYVQTSPATYAYAGQFVAEGTSYAYGVVGTAYNANSGAGVQGNYYDYGEQVTSSDVFGMRGFAEAFNSSRTGEVVGVEGSTYAEGAASTLVGVRGIATEGDWSESGDLLYGGYFEGNGYGHENSYGIYSSVSQPMTSSTGYVYGAYLTASHSGSGGYAYGFRAEATRSGSSGTTVGGYAIAYPSTAGTGYGLEALVSSPSGASGTAYGLYAYVNNNSIGIKRTIYAVKSGGGSYAGYFSGDVYIGGNLSKTSGSFVQPHRSDPTKEIVYNFFEGPEHAVFIRGTAFLEDGRAVIEMPEHWRQVAADEGITVHLTPIGAWAPLYAASATTREVVVESAPGLGPDDLEFAYYIVAKRDGFQAHEPIQENEHFKPDPDESAWSFANRWTENTLTNVAIREMMISNGTLNEDLTLNMETAKRMGWKVVPNEEDHIYCIEHDLPCADPGRADLTVERPVFEPEKDEQRRAAESSSDYEDLEWDRYAEESTYLE